MLIKSMTRKRTMMIAVCALVCKFALSTEVPRRRHHQALSGTSAHAYLLAFRMRGTLGWALPAPKVALLAHLRGGRDVQGGLDDSADEETVAANELPSATPELHAALAGGRERLREAVNVMADLDKAIEMAQTKVEQLGEEADQLSTDEMQELGLDRQRLMDAIVLGNRTDIRMSAVERINALEARKSDLEVPTAREHQ